MEYPALQRQLSETLDEKRYKHSLGVSITAEQLAKRFGVSPEKARLAGLLHDCAREYPVSQMEGIAEGLQLEFTELERSAPILLHALIGAELAGTKYLVADPEIKQAIRLHSTGGAGMSKLDKVVYLADMIEPARDYPEVGALRRIAERDLNEALLEALEQSIRFIIKKRSVLHPGTLEARNEILLKGLY